VVHSVPRQAQRSFGLSSFRDVVEGCADLARPLASGLELRNRIRQDPAGSAILGTYDAHEEIVYRLTGLVSDLCRLLVAWQRRTIFPDGLPARVREGTTTHLIRGQPENVLGSLVGGNDTAVAILVHHTQGHGLEEIVILLVRQSVDRRGVPLGAWLWSPGTCLASSLRRVA